MTVYEIVTDRIIKELQTGQIPWRKPWISLGMQEGAYNRITKRPYSMLNQMLLKKSGEYATFRQWTTLGGHIQSGAKPDIIVFWKINEFDEKKENGDIEIKRVPVLRYYRVFHISQVKGVDPLDPPAESSDIGIESGDQLIESYISRESIKIIKDEISDRAFYSPSRDYIQVPCKKQYPDDISEFYSTVFHEMSHSTGHVTRLDRNMMSVTSFASEDYSKEELIAELSSAMIMNILKIETRKTFKNSTAYIQGWMSQLKKDNRLIVSAANKAEKAVKYILYGKEGI